MINFPLHFSASVLLLLLGTGSQLSCNNSQTDTIYIKIAHNLSCHMEQLAFFLLKVVLT